MVDSVYQTKLVTGNLLSTSRPPVFCHSALMWGVGGTVASESVLKSAGTLLSRVQAPLLASQPARGPENLPDCKLWRYGGGVTVRTSRANWPNNCDASATLRLQSREPAENGGDGEVMLEPANRDMQTALTTCLLQPSHNHQVENVFPEEVTIWFMKELANDLFIEETNGLLVIWRQLKARHSAFSRAESARKKRSHKRKNQECFIRDPFQFARQLFRQPKSGTLTADREEIETHLKKTYSDPIREKESTGLVWPAAPGIKFDSKPPSLQEVIAVVNKARAKSAPGFNGVPYLLYKKYPNVLKKLRKILRSAWKNIKVSKEWMTAEEVYIRKEQDSKGITSFAQYHCSM
ncbi:polyprotein [Plakobranchus ocellatus]|uniref:Polyprotein n=1 Tax=Plakobranchus ocellatus TaxID=259542 RepID=A0AAV4B869_9GAST|nr:polyprotein [Plakobranchus ocellatus]